MDDGKNARGDTKGAAKGRRGGGAGREIGGWRMKEKWPKDSFWHDKWQGLKADPDNPEP